LNILAQDKIGTGTAEKSQVIFLDEALFLVALVLGGGSAGIASGRAS
jgi:hypothetical protein